MDRYGAFWLRLRWWGAFMYYGGAFGVFSYFFLADRSVGLAIFGGVACGTISVLLRQRRLNRRADS